MTTAHPVPLRIGISSCLLGEHVRFDGGHKRDPFLVDTFGRYVEWVPICPEVEAGFGTPRESMRLVLPDDAHGGDRAELDMRRVHLVTPRSDRDVTAQLTTWSARRVESLGPEELSGYLLKKDSPSCGMARVKVYDRHQTPARVGRGLFADALLRRWPSLPVEEEGRLTDPRLRENFIERVFAYRRLRDFFKPRWTQGDLVRFHTAQKLVLLSHQPTAYQALGRLVAGARRRRPADVQAEYEAAFMAALTMIATPRKHTNVLMHMLGYFKKTLDTADREELLRLIDEYRVGQLPLIVPMTLLRHHVDRQAVAYLQGQVYLEPHPRELALRNHV